MVNASDCGSEDRGFESHHSPHTKDAFPGATGRGRRKSKIDRLSPALPDYTGMSPSGKAPDFDSGIRRFESCHPSHLVEVRFARLENGESLRLPPFPRLCFATSPLPHATRFAGLARGPRGTGAALPTAPPHWAPAGAPGESDSLA